MTENEHLLLCLAEECDEVGQRVMKALRFGLGEIQPGQPSTNAERITHELHDLISVASILGDMGVIPNPYPVNAAVEAKAAKIAKFMEIGRREGVLSPAPTPTTGA
jgi:NTP pyrophosphatase (non-canonical NTP hydrolase)